MVSRLIAFLLHRFVRGDVAARFLGAQVGKHCRIITSRLGSEPWLISIGDRVTIAADVHLLTHDGATWLVRDERGRRYRYGRIEVGNDVFIGVGSVILPGVRIGDRVIVGAGSVVTKSVPPGALVAGIPARIIGRFEDYERRARQTFVSKADMTGSDFKSQVLSVTPDEWQPELRWPDGRSGTVSADQ